MGIWWHRWKRQSFCFDHFVIVVVRPVRVKALVLINEVFIASWTGWEAKQRNNQWFMRHLSVNHPVVFVMEEIDLAHSDVFNNQQCAPIKKYFVVEHICWAWWFRRWRLERRFNEVWSDVTWCLFSSHRPRDSRREWRMSIGFPPVLIWALIGVDAYSRWDRFFYRFLRTYVHSIGLQYVRPLSVNRRRFDTFPLLLPFNVPIKLFQSRSFDQSDADSYSRFFFFIGTCLSIIDNMFLWWCPWIEQRSSAVSISLSVSLSEELLLLMIGPRNKRTGRWVVFIEFACLNRIVNEGLFSRDHVKLNSVHARTSRP